MADAQALGKGAERPGEPPEADEDGHQEIKRVQRESSKKQTVHRGIQHLGDHQVPEDQGES